MDLDLLHPRDQVAMVMSRLYGHRLTTMCGGNVSVLSEDGSVWITPAAVDKGALTPRDIVRVRPSGEVEGRYPPSSELPLHRAVYDARPDVRCVLHAHPTSLVAFSLSGHAPEARLLPEAWRRNGEVAFVRWAAPGSSELGDLAAEAFGAGSVAAVLARHGAVCVGASADDAFARFDTLEFAARAEMRARLLGAPHPLSDAELAHERVRAPARRSPPHQPGATPLREREAREAVCAFMERGLRHRLFLPSVGTVSVRLSPDDFLVTPHPCDRLRLRPDDLVLVRGGLPEEGRSPSRLTRFHEAVYLTHPGVNAVINASPLNALAFSLCRRPVGTAVLPEVAALVGDSVPLVPFEEFYLHPELSVARLGPDRPVLEIGNNGVVAVGADLLQAYNRLETLENAADAQIGAAALARTRA